jgi:predicted transposase/invertase (TIGR01784 family)
LERLMPLNDVVFKKLFGENQSKELLITLLNVILKSDIVDIQIREEKLTREKIDDKQGVLDIKAECNNGDLIDIEVQLRDQKNMIQRTLFYWSNLYSSNFKEGQDYNLLRRTIVINLLGFNLVEDDPYHSVYHLREETTLNKLTDLIEVHFIEFPKFKKVRTDLHNPLHRWLLFLKGDTPDTILREVVNMDQMIKRADDKLNFLSANEEVRRLAELRDKGIADQKAREDWLKENHAIEIANNLIQMGMSLEDISKAVSIPIEDLKQILKQ